MADSQTGLPPGAVVLTREMFDATWHTMVRLPNLSRRVARMSTLQLMQDGYLRPLSEWDPVEVERVRTVVVAAREAAGLPVSEVPVSENAILNARARELRRDGILVEIGVVGYAEVLSIQPIIEGSEQWPSEPTARAEAFQLWFGGQTPEAQKAHLQDLVDTQYRMVSLGLLSPKLTPAEVVRWKDDAIYLAGRIAELAGVSYSGDGEPAELPEDEPVSAPAPVEPPVEVEEPPAAAAA